MNRFDSRNTNNINSSRRSSSMLLALDPHIERFFNMLLNNVQANELQNFLLKYKNEAKEFHSKLKNQNGYTALHICCILGNLEALKQCFHHYLEVIGEEYVDICQLDDNKYSCLHFACNEDFADMVQFLLLLLDDHHPASIEKQLECNLKCCVIQSSDTVSYLSGFSSMPLFASGGRTVMHYCAEKGSFESAKVVMDFVNKYGNEEVKKKMFVKDFDGLTPYDLAVLNSRLIGSEMCEFIYQAQKSAVGGDLVQYTLNDEEKKERKRRIYELQVSRENLRSRRASSPLQTE